MQETKVSDTILSKLKNIKHEDFVDSNCKIGILDCNHDMFTYLLGQVVRSALDKDDNKKLEDLRVVVTFSNKIEAQVVY